MHHYRSLWKRTFDYEGYSAREEYIVPLIVTVLLGAATAALWFIGYRLENFILIAVGNLFGTLFTAHMIPMTALTVRRLRDAGKSDSLIELCQIVAVWIVFVSVTCLFLMSFMVLSQDTFYRKPFYRPGPFGELY